MTATAAPGQGRIGWPARLAEGLARLLDAEQDRWFLWLPVAFGAGIATYFASPTEPPLAVVAGVAIAGLVLRFLWRETLAAILVTSTVLAIAAGLFAAKLRAEWVAAPVVTREIRPVPVSGWIELVEPRPARGQRITVRVAVIDGMAPEATPQRVRIRLMAAEPGLKPGDAVRVRAALSPPAGPALPGGFDFARSAWFQGLGAVGYAREGIERIVIERPLPSDLAWRAPIERLRQEIGQRVVAALPGEAGAIANALITGERGGISDATNEAYRDSGLLHILSISGLHMVIMAGAVFLSVRFLLTLSPTLALGYPIKKWAAFAAALGALAYLLISGASFPTVRSYIMISIMFLAVLLDRPAVALRNVALSAFAILIVYPESLIDVGFQMSFAAVTALVSAYEVLRERARARDAGRERDPSMFRSGLAFFGGILLSTLIASIAVAPFAAYHFHKSQQFAMIANLIAIPICNLVVMPAALVTLIVMPLGLEAWPLRAMGLGIDAMTWCAYRVAALPGAVGRLPEMPTLAFGLMVAGGIWLALWSGRWRYGGLIAVLAGLLVAPMRFVPDIYVGRDGLVAVRGADGRLSALSPRGASFDLARILEHDGDGRRPDDVARAQGFRCDWSGCAVRARSHVVAVAGHPAAFADDCRIAAFVIALDAAVERSPLLACQARVIVTPDRLQRLGAHAVRIETGSEGDPVRTTVVTVADQRGDRPWTRTDATAPPGRPLWSGPPLSAMRTPRASPQTSPAPRTPDRDDDP